MPETSEESAVSELAGAECGALCAELALSDPDLLAIVNAWSKLPEAVRVGLLAMVRAAAD